jgi:hypothetical protein
MNIAHRRLLNQHIAGEKLSTPGDVVRWLGAVQAQDYGQALWAIGVRTEGSTLAGVERAIEEGSILRTWPMRGTIHFVPPEDAQWMLQLCASRMLAADDRRLGQLDLDVKTMERCEAIFVEALSGGKRLARPDMLQLLESRGIHQAGQRGYHILWYLAQSGVICLGPMQGKQQTFALLDEWAPNPRMLEREEALAELTRRYFTSHGPATVHDFAWWSGLTITDTRRGLEMTKADLEREQVDGVDYWMSPDDGREGDTAGVYLLPGYDEYFIAYRNRDAVIQPEHAGRVVPGGNGVFQPTLVIDGQVVGTWRRTVKKRGVDIAFSPFTPLDDLDERVREAADAYSRFVGLPIAALTIGAG